MELLCQTECEMRIFEWDMFWSTSYEMVWAHGERLVKLIYRAGVDETRESDRPRTGWLDGVKKVLGEKVWPSSTPAGRCLQDRIKWRNMWGMNVTPPPH